MKKEDFLEILRDYSLNHGVLAMAAIEETGRGVFEDKATKKTEYEYIWVCSKFKYNSK